MKSAARPKAELQKYWIPSQKLKPPGKLPKALRPLAGQFATLFYTLGILGVGFLAILVLAGSAAYALAETFDWPQGLDEKFEGAREFYITIIFSVALGILFDFLHVNPLKALFWTGVLNGLLAPFLLIGILMVARDRKLMQGQPSSELSQAVVILTTLLMFGAALGMFIL